MAWGSFFRVNWLVFGRASQTPPNHMLYTGCQMPFRFFFFRVPWLLLPRSALAPPMTHTHGQIGVLHSPVVRPLVVDAQIYLGSLQA